MNKEICFHASKYITTYVQRKADSPIITFYTNKKNIDYEHMPTHERKLTVDNR